MTVNIVTKPGWILERLAREVAARVPGVTVNAGADERTVDARADLQYYLPARDIHKFPCDGRSVGFFTHGDTGFELIKRFAGVAAMNTTMAARLREAGASDVALLRPGIDPPARPIVFGVIGRVYNNGRKGESLIRDAVRAGFSCVSCGPSRRDRSLTRKQWPCPKTHDLSDRAGFYASIDYLIVSSLEEGGPMPVPEALAHGVPVIAPNVGWCWEFPVIRYEVGSWPSLKAVLDGLTQTPTWDAWGEGHRRWFDTLTERAV